MTVSEILGQLIQTFLNATFRTAEREVTRLHLSTNWNDIPTKNSSRSH